MPNTFGACVLLDLNFFCSRDELVPPVILSPAILVAALLLRGPSSLEGISGAASCPFRSRLDCGTGANCYSNRSALTGSTRAARRPGIQQDPSATSNKSPATVEMIDGSFAETP